MKPVGDQGRTLTEKVLVELKGGILQGELASGSLHSLADLASQLGVSRTPVREAVLQLESQRMVRFERNRGVRIVQMSEHDLEEIFSLRLLLEVPATFRATPRFSGSALRKLRREYDSMMEAAKAGDKLSTMLHDKNFHGLILEAAGNMRLASFVGNLRGLVLRHGPSTFSGSRTLGEIVLEHESILLAIEANNADKAADTMASHITHTAELLIEQEFPPAKGSRRNSDVATSRVKRRVPNGASRPRR